MFLRVVQLFGVAHRVSAMMEDIDSVLQYYGISQYSDIFKGKYHWNIENVWRSIRCIFWCILYFVIRIRIVGINAHFR
jgi:hypothetical protein